MMNAIEAMSEVAENPRELLIASEKDEPSTVRIAVCDSGRGLSPESLSRMFSAFYTAKPQGIGGATFHFTLPGGGAA